MGRLEGKTHLNEPATVGDWRETGKFLVLRRTHLGHVAIRPEGSLVAKAARKWPNIRHWQLGEHFDMPFKAGKRRGKVWEDACELDRLIRQYDFRTTGKKESDFEIGFSHVIVGQREKFSSTPITQKHKSAPVRSVFCFGKNHRPDMTLSEDGIAIEIKFATYAGIRDAIGQGLIYRFRYKFVFLIIILAEKKKATYSDIKTEKEQNLDDLLQYLADEMNIFTYIAPNYKPRRGEPNCIAYFESRRTTQP